LCQFTPALRSYQPLFGKRLYQRIRFRKRTNALILRRHRRSLSVHSGSHRHSVS
jgi:hypothetical protein